MPDLDGKVALVTGGSKGIGRAIALAYAEEGADVALTARGKDALDQTAKEVEALGRRALAVPADAADLEQVRSVVEQTVEGLGTVDILVNNAGAAPFMSTVDSIRMEGFEKYFRINFMSAVYATQAVAPIFVRRGSGVMVNVASVAGIIASPGLTYYSTAKAAMINLTKTVAREWAPLGPRANAVAPGWIETEMNAVARQDPTFTEGIRSLIPLGRWGTAEEVAQVALFLASDRSAFMTGSVVVLDGGQTLMNLGSP